MSAQVNYINPRYTFGCNVPGFPLITETIANVSTKPYTAFQFMLQGHLAKQMVTYDVGDVLEARNMVKELNIHPVIHGSLAYNLAGKPKHKDDPKFEWSLKTTIEGLTSELDVAAGLGTGVVCHIGCCRRKTIGLKTIIDTIQKVLTMETDYSVEFSEAMGLTQDEFIGTRKLILENASGNVTSNGSKLGCTLKEIALIINGVDEDLRPQIKVCIDTAHAFSAGQWDWGISTEVDRFYKEFSELIGLEYLEMFHLNDSRQSENKRYNACFDSGRDVHENLLEGYIFSDEVGEEVPLGSRIYGLKNFLLKAGKYGIKIIGEPPGKTKYDEVGPGWRQDQFVIEELLKDTEHPLYL